MLDVSRLHQDKLREIGELYQQKLSQLADDTRFSTILAGKLNLDQAAGIIAPAAKASDADTQAETMLDTTALNTTALDAANTQVMQDTQAALLAQASQSPQIAQLLQQLQGTELTPEASAALLALSQNTAAQAVTPTAPAAKADPSAYDDIIAIAAAQYDLPENLIKGVIRAESNFRTTAVSSAGAMGLMQLMPKTAEVYGVTDAFDPMQNILAGSRYIRFQLNRFGDIRLALAAYNTGPSRIRGLEIDNPDDPAQYERISERVRGYVDKVLGYAEQYAQA